MADPVTSPRKTYSEKLRDPRWQKQRLQILERDGWACRICLDTETTLHVHHRIYVKGVEPWGYHEDWLVTLCEDCHQGETEDRPQAEHRMCEVMRFFVFSSELTDLAEELVKALNHPGYGGVLRALKDLNPEAGDDA